VTGRRWVGHQIKDIIHAESGASLEELARRTGATYADVRAAAGALYGRRQADYCWRYLTAVPRSSEGRRSA
jgi:hypothetical protein